MKNTGPFSLRKKLHDATEKVSQKLSEMSYEERRKACRKAYLKFAQKDEDEIEENP